MKNRFLPVVFLAVLTGCAGSDAQFNDPFEPFNRSMFAINQGLDKVILKPTAKAYGVLPQPVRSGVGNVLSNAALPVTFFNQTLQGNPGGAGTTLARFSINTTVGLAGLFDVATPLGYEHMREDFGQTLAVYGVGTGPYIFLPVLGPGNPRDFIGRVADLGLDPVYWIDRDEDSHITAARTAAGAIHAREKSLELFDELENTSVDFYASVRSLYTQNREAAIDNGATDIDSLPDVDDLDDF